MYYLRMEAVESLPLGRLGKIEDHLAYIYEPETDTWRRWEYGDALQWGQGPWEDWDAISDEEGEFLKYQLQVAEALAVVFPLIYKDPVERFLLVKNSKGLIRTCYERGEDAEDAAAGAGYCCG